MDGVCRNGYLMITVACVLRSGGVYDPEWVERLQRGVAAHMTRPYRFLCLSDVPVPCDRTELQNHWPGWWSKLELFTLPGPVLYLDLDCIVTGPLDDLVQDTPSFTMCDDFLRPGVHNSSAMSWRGDFSEIERLFAESPRARMDQYRRTSDGRIGDQAWIEDVLATTGQTIRTFPTGRVVSYRVSAKDQVPDGASVVSFHGRPKPHEVKNGWVASAWT